MNSRHWIGMLLLLALAACGIRHVSVTPQASLEALTQTAVLARTPTAETSVTPTTALATETPLPALAVLLAPEGSDSTLAQALQAGLEKTMAEAGLQWEKRASITSKEVGLRLVVALPPDPGIASLAAAAPQVQFLAVGILQVQPAKNLSVVGAEGDRPDQQGFTAGYVAALITSDWRVGGLSVADTLAGKLARQGFVNGAVYFCGLCLAYHGPSGDYPVYAELPGSAASAEWQAAAQQLIDKDVKTVFLTPGAGDEASWDLLVKSGANFIGSQAPIQALQAHWVASVVSDPLPAIQELLPDVLKGKSGQSLPMPVKIVDVNPDLLSPGRQQLAEKMLGDLMNGLIDTGFDPITGEPH